MNELDIPIDDLDTTILNTRRVGRSANNNGQGHPQKLVVELSSAQLRQDILRNSPKLRNSGQAPIYISPDLTRKQQEQDRLLRAELKRRRADGESVVIRDGCVVQGAQHVPAAMQSQFASNAGSPATTVQ